MINETTQPKIRFKEFKKDWIKIPVGKVCTFKDSDRKPLSSEERSKRQGIYPYYGASKIIDYIDDYIFDGEYVLLGEDGANILSRSTPLAFVISGKVWVNNHAHIMKAHGNNKFLAESLERIRYEKYNTGTAQPKLNSDICKKIMVNYPPEQEEEQRIASFLSTVDEKISMLKEKHALLEQYKAGVLQNILSSKIRFKDEFGNEFPKWKERKFNEFISPRSEFPHANDNAPLSSLTIANGIEAKSARYVRDFLVTDDKGAYKSVYPEDFVANPMNLRFGAIAKNNSSLKVKISKYYDVFICDDSIDNDFFELYLLSYEMRKQYQQTATGTLEEKKRVHFSEFINFKKKLPSKPEQMKISNFNETLKSKLSLLKQQIEQTQTFKKGLLQQMFV